VPKTKSPRLAIVVGSLTAGEGPLYPVHCEDEVAHCFDCWITVEAGGKTYMMAQAVRGFATDPEGFSHPNRNYRNQLDALLAQIEAVGSINPALWTETAPDWEARQLAAYRTDDTRDENDERAAWGLPPL
jgi:hypothetical protein